MIDTTHIPLPWSFYSTVPLRMKECFLLQDGGGRSEKEHDGGPRHQGRGPPRHGAGMEVTEKVLRIRIHMFLGLPDPDPLVRGMNPDPAPDPFYHHAKIVRKTLIPTIL